MAAKRAANRLVIFPNKTFRLGSAEVHQNVSCLGCGPQFNDRGLTWNLRFLMCRYRWGFGVFIPGWERPFGRLPPVISRDDIALGMLIMLPSEAAASRSTTGSTTGWSATGSRPGSMPAGTTHKRLATGENRRLQRLVGPLSTVTPLR